MEVKIHNLMHPNTNSSNWLVKCFPCYLYTSDGCKSREKLCLNSAPSAIACQHVWCQGREHRQCWDGGELWYSSALCCVPRHSPHVHGAVLSPPVCPRACSSCTCNHGCETFTGLIQSSHLCHAEMYLRRKRPLLVCQAVYSPHCIQSLFTVVPQRLNQREQGTKTF